MTMRRVEKLGNISTPDCARCEPYYNLANCDLVARNYIGSRRVVKKEKSMEGIMQTRIGCDPASPGLRPKSSGTRAAGRQNRRTPYRIGASGRIDES